MYSIINFVRNVGLVALGKEARMGHMPFLNRAMRP